MKDIIAIIQYGSGNVAAIMNILKQRKIPHILTNDPRDLVMANRYILPGVGAFDPTMEHLCRSGVIDTLNEEVLIKRKRVLGICVGMHLLADGSDEGERPGLGWISGRVRRIDPEFLPGPPLLPHMGWNSIQVQGSSSLFSKVDLCRGFYFLHSYYFDAADEKHVAASVSYGRDLACVVQRDNIFGVQFHPEKSHSNGMRIFSNFATLT